MVISIDKSATDTFFSQSLHQRYIKGHDQNGKQKWLLLQVQLSGLCGILSRATGRSLKRSQEKAQTGTKKRKGKKKRAIQDLDLEEDE